MNPVWEEFEINIGRLCNGNPNENFRIECWNQEKANKKLFIGGCELNLNEVF